LLAVTFELHIYTYCAGLCSHYVVL